MNGVKANILAACLLFCGGASGARLQVSSATLDAAGVSTASRTPENAQTVQLNQAGDVLVLCSMTISGSEGFLEVEGGYGAWQLSCEDQRSIPILRSMDHTVDQGSASAVYIFTNLPSGADIALQHKVSKGDESITTSRANLIAVPLTVSSGETMNYGIAQQLEGTQTVSQTYIPTGLETALELDRSATNGMYMAVSFNVQSLNAAEAGRWTLQYRKAVDESWINTGSEVRQVMSEIGEKWILTLYALEENLDDGRYEVRLAMRSEGGGLIETLNGTLAVVSLYYDNGEGGGYFDGVSLTATNLVPRSGIETNDSSSIDFPVPQDQGGFIAALSFTGNAGADTGEFGETGLFGLLVDGSISNQPNTRYFKTSADSGSIASVGCFSGLSNGTHRILGYRSGSVEAQGVTLVGFSTVSDAGQAVPDADADGLPDSWELLYFPDVSEAAPDEIAANGINTMKEAYISGINPTEPEAGFQMDSLTEAGGAYVLTWQGVPGRVYTVYWAPDLQTPFTVLAGNLPWDAGSFIDTLHPESDQGFYRIEAAIEP